MRILVNEFCGHAFQIELSRELARRGHHVLHLYFADNLSTPKGDVEPSEEGLSNFAIEGLHVPMKFSKHSRWNSFSNILLDRLLGLRLQRYPYVRVGEKRKRQINGLARRSA